LLRSACTTNEGYGALDNPKQMRVMHAAERVNVTDRHIRWSHSGGLARFGDRLP